MDDQLYIDNQTVQFNTKNAATFEIAKMTNTKGFFCSQVAPLSL